MAEFEEDNEREAVRAVAKAIREELAASIGQAHGERVDQLLALLEAKEPDGAEREFWLASFLIGIHEELVARLA